jgi:hypothetical protein
MDDADVKKKKMATSPKPVASVKKKKLSRKKLPTLSKLKKRAHELWSLCARTRDGSCLLTGNTETLQVHHWIVSAARSLKYRYDLRNSVTLCFSSHLRGVHTEASYAYTKRIADACVANGIVTWPEIEEIMNDPTKTTDYNREELNAIIARLQGQLAELQARKSLPSLYSPQPTTAVNSCSENTASAALGL